MLSQQHGYSCSTGNKKQHSSLLSSRHGNPKKLMDLLGPLLGSSPTAAGNNNILPSAQKPFALATPGKPVVVSLYAVCASDSDVASTASSSSERNSSNSDTPLEPVNMSALAQSLSTSSNRLTEFMNKMRLAEPAVQKGWKIGPDGEETGAPTFGSPVSVAFNLLQTDVAHQNLCDFPQTCKVQAAAMMCCSATFIDT